MHQLHHRQINENRLHAVGLPIYLRTLIPLYNALLFMKGTLDFVNDASADVYSLISR